ncbi:MAG TPA: hypothetical protein VJS63_12815 [Bradyrhizobium sp.]|nr:hypothetical protein [Bradyrhizobium sp.]
MLDYDLMVLAVAIAFLARHGQKHGFADFEISLLAAAWIVPLLSRGVTGATGVPLGLLVLLALSWIHPAPRGVRARNCKWRRADGAGVIQFVLTC